MNIVASGLQSNNRITSNHDALATLISSVQNSGDNIILCLLFGTRKYHATNNYVSVSREPQNKQPT